MLYSCFLLNDELDMLELRLQQEAGFTDRFVIVEGRETFLRRLKPCYLKENWARFINYHDRITRIEFDGNVGDVPVIPAGAYRTYETAQRHAILRGLRDARDEDVVLITDIDEVPSHETLSVLKLGISGKIRLDMKFYYYSLYCVRNERWQMAVALPYGVLKNTSPFHARHFIEDGETLRVNSGWHLSFLGSNEVIRRKLSCYSEFWLNYPIYTSDSNLERARNAGVDFAGRSAVTMQWQRDLGSIPESVRANKSKYAALGWLDRPKGEL